MAVKDIIPDALIKLATEFGVTTGRKTSAVDATVFLTPAPSRMSFGQTKESATFYENVCEAIMCVEGDVYGSDGQVTGRPAARTADILDDARRKHGFKGTFVLALIDRVHAGRGGPRFDAVRQEAFRRRAEEPVVWELMRNFGRPTVPKHVLPVFAVYEMEKRIGRAIETLTESELEMLGVA